MQEYPLKCASPLDNLGRAFVAEKPHDLQANQSHVGTGVRIASATQRPLTQPDLCRARTENPYDYKYFGEIPIKPKF